LALGDFEESCYDEIGSEDLKEFTTFIDTGKKAFEEFIDLLNCKYQEQVNSKKEQLIEEKIKSLCPRYDSFHL
jgi:hypothetical protein